MKKSILKAAISAGVVTAASSASAGMLSLDSWQAAGDQQFHYVITHGGLYRDIEGSATTGNTENQTLRIHYRNDLDASGNVIPGTEGITNRNLDCSDPDNGTLEGYHESWRADQVNTYVSAYGGQLPENSGSNANQCDIDIGAAGEVLGGYSANLPTVFVAQTVTSFTVLTPPRRLASYRGTCDGIDINTAFQTIALYDNLIAANGSVAPGELDSAAGAPTLPAGCTTFGLTRVTLGQCDPIEAETDGCNNVLAKSVPVPAFAAAALGLGLMGITYLTARRRKVS